MIVCCHFRSTLYLPIGVLCAISSIALGCSGLPRRQLPLPVSSQIHENAGFVETNWRPLAGGPTYPTQGYESPIEHVLPPIVGSEAVALSSHVRHGRPVNQDTQTLHNRLFSDQANVRTAAGERPVSTHMQPAKLYREHTQSLQVEGCGSEALPYNYYAP